jgi:hypothetical protein
MTQLVVRLHHYIDGKPVYFMPVVIDVERAQREGFSAGFNHPGTSGTQTHIEIAPPDQSRADEFSGLYRGVVCCYDDDK